MAVNAKWILKLSSNLAGFLTIEYYLINLYISNAISPDVQHISELVLQRN